MCESPSFQLISSFFFFFRFSCVKISAFSFVFSLFLIFYPDFTVFFLVLCMWPFIPLLLRHVVNMIILLCFIEIGTHKLNFIFCYLFVFTHKCWTFLFKHKLFCIFLWHLVESCFLNSNFLHVIIISIKLFHCFGMLHEVFIECNKSRKFIDGLVLLLLH